MYLGEIARNVILSLIDATPKPLLFGGRSSAQLNKQWGLDTALLSEIEEAWEGLGQFSSQGQVLREERLRRIRGVLAHRLELSPPDISLEDADIVRQVCTLIGSRAARLSATAVAAILVHTGRAKLAGGDSTGLKDEGQRIGVGVDGRYEKHDNPAVLADKDAKAWSNSTPTFKQSYEHRYGRSLARK